MSKNYPLISALVKDLGALVEPLAASAGVDPKVYWQYLGSISDKTGDRVKDFYHKFCLKQG
jgi:hypothetical protein